MRTDEAQPGKRVRAVVVDDHPMVLDATRSALLAARLATDVDCVATLHDVRERLAQAPDTAIVILDLSLADAHGLEALLSLREDFPDVPVLIFSGDESPETIANAFECSARGYVPKTQTIAALAEAVRMVLAGGTYIPPHALRAFLSQAPAGSAPVPRLTPRQQDVYRLLLQGMPNKVIASRLGMSVNTAKSHISALFATLGVANRTQAVLRGRMFGMV